MKNSSLKSSLSFNIERVKKAIQFFKPILKYYFRAEVRDLQNIPKKQTVLISNHDGGMLPIDTILFLSRWHEHFEYSRPIFILVHDIVFQLFGPWKNILYEVGCLPADQENLKKVLEKGYDLFIYPGGARETFRTFWDRKKITLGNRSGFIRHVLENKTLLTPLVSVGVHETFFVLSQGEWIAKKLGLYKHLRADVFPLVAGFPFGVWIGAGIPQFPLPSKIVMKVLPSLNLSQKKKKSELNQAIQSPKNSPLISKLFIQIRNKMQKEHSKLYAERKIPIIG